MIHTSCALALPPADRKDLSMSYCLWCLSFVGICGVQRIYLGHTFMGILMLFTFGFCGVGQVLDLFLLPDAVERKNAANTKDTAYYETNYERLRDNNKTTFTQQSDTSHKNGAGSTLNEDVDLAELLKNARDAVNRTDKL